ncbi:carboxypeptidase-like regulatory domain-containing protein [Telmatobacter sp. DSM 110680]|uniref:Carboxypeptidase-like regulatory domain-containing protein n=1 Tax=Telmatobacter sp. DSM 110680 TaxID=3036704 RepID=A0AAU7DFU8_9BACT
MKRRVNSSLILARPAGLWLRCFLAAVFCVGLAGANSLRAQIDVPGPERLSHVEGYVVNPVGHPAADLEVTLVRDNKIAYQTRTDKNGEFRFDHVSGQFTFRVVRSEYSAAVREIVVTDEIVTTLERKKLYVILGPGACKDECSSVLTSKRDFERAIKAKNKH